jgi:hypothetical protein
VIRKALPEEMAAIDLRYDGSKRELLESIGRTIIAD